MSYVIVPEDTYTVSAGDYKLKGYYDKTISYSASTNTSEGFLDNLINSVSQQTSRTTFNTYKNQNYTTLDWCDNGQHFSIVSNTANLSTENYWMYPVVNEFKHTDILNFPVTRTISIIINSSTLPVYTIPNNIILGMDVYGSYKELTIPAGDHTYSTIDNLLYNFIANHSDRLTQYLNLPYFRYTRLISNTNGSVIIRDNPEFNKYYGLLHMIYTYPANHGINTSTETKKFCANMAPVYRSLYIQEGSYTAEEFVNYIKNNSEYHYTRAGTDTYSYTQFLAKIVGNDIVIYTNDGTSFFINPICKMNTYKETNFASEHRLCAVSNYNFSYNDFTYNCTDTSYTISANTIKPVNPVNITSYSLAEGITLPSGLTLNTSTGEITGTVNYTSLSDKYINTTITIKGFIANTNISIERSFNLYLNFLRIKYSPSTAYIYHQSNKTTNINISILRGHYSSAWFEVTKAPNDQAVINMTAVLNKSFNSETCEFNTTIPASTIHDGEYSITTYISDTDKNGNVYTVNAKSTINVYNTPEINYASNTYYGNLGEQLSIYCNTKYTHDTKSFALSSSSNRLPTGLTLNTSTGTISGTISVNATIKSYNISVTLTDRVGTTSYSASDSFTIVVRDSGKISYNDYIVNTTNTTYEVSISPTELVNISTMDANLPNGLQIDSQGNITGTINYSDTTNGKVSVTINVHGTTPAGSARSDSFIFFVNFMNIDYNETGSEYHVSENIIWQPTNVRGSITSASIVDCASNLTVTMSDNYNLLINTGISSGTYQFTVKLTDEKGQTVTKVMTVNVFRRPSLNYNTTYTYEINQSVNITPTYTYAKVDGDYTYSIVGDLPSGLSFNNGIITGSTNETGSYNITVTLNNPLNDHECEYNSVSDSFTISIISFGYSQSEYTFTVNESISIIPASGNYTYSGNLPCGLTFGSDGSITGVCDHPVITVLSITINASDITKTVELTLNILPTQCKENDYCNYYVDFELWECLAIQDKGVYKDGTYHYLLEDNENVGTVGPYLYILPPKHAIDLNIRTIDNYGTNYNNINCYIKGFPNDEYYNYIQPLEDVKQYDSDRYYSYIQIRNEYTDEIIEESDGFDLSNLDFTNFINYFNEKSNKQLSITSDEYCLCLHGVDFALRQPIVIDDVQTQYFTNTVLALEYHMNDTKIVLLLGNDNYQQLFYNNKIYFTAYPESNINFDIPLTNIDNTHAICTYENTASHPVVLYMDVGSSEIEENSPTDLKTMYQVQKFVYEIGKLYDLIEFTIPIGCYFTTTPGTEIAGPYVLEGVLPNGLIFDPDTGNISGTCNEIINSSVNIIASDNTSDQLTFNTVDIQNYNNVYRILNDKTTTINPITPINNYLNGVVTYENVLPNGCTFDTSTGALTINTSNKYEYISVNCIQTLTNTELKINNNILIKIIHNVQVQDNIVNYS